VSFSVTVKVHKNRNQLALHLFANPFRRTNVYIHDDHFRKILSGHIVYAGKTIYIKLNVQKKHSAPAVFDEQ
jgi:hypothetical protein